MNCKTKHIEGEIMQHLSTEDIIRYITVGKLSEEDLEVISRVNLHIRDCRECAEKVEAFEIINGKLRGINIESVLVNENVEEIEI
ncbi:MAG: hypothetical protein IIX14_07630 [Clostridia bacterium]|nr:hypothetical protein [Clostridia bacterium]